MFETYKFKSLKYFARILEGEGGHYMV